MSNRVVQRPMNHRGRPGGDWDGIVGRGSCDVERIPVGYLARLLSLDEIQP
jgi:hypothetical protein